VPKYLRAEIDLAKRKPQKQKRFEKKINKITKKNQTEQNALIFAYIPKGK
tara:strand:+ start:930 stop:1079 length:150 start_codon:yes stop_codon:yes gene_type:complete